MTLVLAAFWMYKKIWLLPIMNQINLWYTLLLMWNFKKVRLAENQEYLYIMVSNSFFFNFVISSMF